MTQPSNNAVFLSYASQDAEAAQRIAEALTAAGLEVWFDQTGLGGGDAWDAEIRGRIRECALFVPIISANTESRLEGYFRLEWRLAEQRTHQMARGKPFLVPVVIDDTRDDKAHVPDCFVDVQWTRLAGGGAAEAFARRIKGLLMQTDAAPVAHGSGHQEAPDSMTMYRATQPVAQKRNSAAWLGLAIFAALLIGIAALWVLSSRRTDTASPTAASSAAAINGVAEVAPGSALRTAVAVLPFANLTGDASKDYLGDGMAEELINTLNKVPGLKVPARTSSFAYKGRNINIRDIAKDLQVGTILEGSVRAAGKRLRIAAQLINAQDGLPLWSQSYDEEFSDIFKLQDKLATQIAKALQPSLGEAGQAVVAQAPPTQDIEAYQLYLQANSLLDRTTSQNYQRASDLAARAVARDPKFARAYGALAFANLGLYQRGQAAEHLAAAEKFAHQALALDPDTSLAQSVLAQISTYAGHWLEMETYSRASLALASADANSFARRSLNLAGMGKLRAATEIAQRAYELAPASARATANLARTFHLQGRETEAMKFANLAVALGWLNYDTTIVNIYAGSARDAGDYAKAATFFVAGLADYNIDESSRQTIVEVIRRAHAAMSDPKQRSAALAALKRVYPALQTASTNGVMLVRECMMGAKWYIQLDAVDDAYDLAMRCPDLGGGTSIGAAATNPSIGLWGPDMRPFRRDPRFQAFVTRMGLMEYWKQYGPPDECDLKDGKLTCH